MLDSTYNEIWKPVVGFENYYEVSSKGNVRSVERITTMKNGVNRKVKSVLKQPGLRADGYLQVDLWRNNVAKSMSVHRLVAQAFIPNPDNLPSVNHKDCNTTNNSVENLEWVDARGNALHAKKMNRLPNNTAWLNKIRPLSNEVTRKACMCLETGEIFKSQADAASKHKISQMSVSNSIHEGRTIEGWTFKRI